jgi:HlyD family type I secretion membrane fusion protein
MLERQYVAYAAEEARLLAEREDMPTLRFPAGIEAHRARSDLAELLGGQERIFVSGRVALDGQIGVLQQKIAQLAAQIAGIQAQLKSGETQLALINDELSGVRDLVEKGLEKRPRLLALERSAAELKGRQGEYANRIAQVREGIAEAEMQILNTRQARVEKAANEVREVQSRRSEFEERLSEAAVKLGRRDVLAPQAGTVLNLRYHTVGGVVAPGAPILDIVPGEDRLIVEAKVSPLDIDVVHSGLTARISLTAYKSRTTPQITGSVLQVSADALTEEHTGRSYFLARIAIDPVELAKLPDVTLTPGMPADTFIETGDRTLLQYLIQPIADSFRRAFRET